MEQEEQGGVLFNSKVFIKRLLIIKHVYKHLSSITLKSKAWKNYF